MASSSSGAQASSFSFRPAAAVPQARAVASPGQKDAQSRRRSSSKSAVMMDSAVLSCPWPRTLEYSSAAPAQGLGIIAGLKQLWAKPGPLPQEVQSLAGGFTDAPNACIIEQDAPKGLATWWRYQGFKL
ncbi:g13159 [Coccomyxa viridis]|uniref:G13159 protein n=1 Tax=Coccomyxa viridis TaxID=1274662 RepID=A0ABP1GEP4_9CHLO